MNNITIEASQIEIMPASNVIYVHDTRGQTRLRITCPAGLIIETESNKGSLTDIRLDKPLHVHVPYEH